MAQMAATKQKKQEAQSKTKQKGQSQPKRFCRVWTVNSHFALHIIGFEGLGLKELTVLLSMQRARLITLLPNNASQA